MKFGAPALRFLALSTAAAYGAASSSVADKDAAANSEAARKTLRGNARNLQGKNPQHDGTVDVIVTLKPECSHGGRGPAGNDRAAAAANDAKAANVANRNGIAPNLLYGAAVVGFAGSVSAERMGDLMTDECVDNVEFDAEVHLDPMEMIDEDGTRRKLQPGGGGGPKGGGSCGGAAPTVKTPWGITKVGGGGEYLGNNRAWIIDTGIADCHPDLNVRPDLGANFVVRGKSTTNDGNGHGTHVAGTVAAICNTQGTNRLCGVAAGAEVVPIRVLDNQGSGSFSWIIAGVNHVVANAQNGDVANMSLGGSGSQTTLENAITTAGAAGIRFVLAAGNSGAHADNFTPARADGLGVYTISASDINNNRPSWSNYGNPPVDYAAPGVDIFSTWSDGDYRTISGTSMAAPHAAGVLLMDSIPGISGYVNNDPDGNADPIIFID